MRKMLRRVVVVRQLVMAGGVSELRPRDEGGIALLGLGLSVCIGMLLTGGVAVTSAQLARMDVLDATDHASASAADRISEDYAYRNGLSKASLAVSDADVEARRVLAATPLPDNVAGWRVVSTSVEGDKVTVRVNATVTPVVIGSVMDALGAPMTVEMVSTADAHVKR